MKTLILISSLFLSFNIFANDKAPDFSRAMIESVQQDLIQHEDAYKKAPTRGPASVDETSSTQRLEDQINQDKKIEKMNFRQNQPGRW